MAGKIVEEQQTTTKSVPLTEVQPVQPSEPNMTVIEGLPSRGAFYPKGTIIKARPLKVIEVKKLSALNESNADHIINDVVRRATTGIAVEDMLVADKIYVIFWLRANTYNEAGYAVDFHCSKCDQDSSYEFTLNNLEVKYIKEETDPNNMTMKLANDQTVEWTLPRVKDERKKSKFHASYDAILPDIDEELLSQAVNIKTIDGEEKNLLEKYNWITEVSPTNYSQMVTEMEKFECGIKPVLNVTCKKCGGTAPVAVTFRDEFFLPRYKAESDS